MKTLNFRRAATVLVVLTPLLPLIIATAAPAQAQSGSRICARWGAQNGKTVYRAIERGDLPADADPEEIFSMAAGPIYFRRLIVSTPITDEWVEKVVDGICDLYGLDS